tara:strand:+ start:3849 stop:5132 length:1284 start_codon:yes stop_codon:yes gene_type:complete
MCGLVGVMGDVTSNDKDVFNQLLVVDVLRGRHSTGAALIDYRGEATVFKKAVNGLDFLDFATYKDKMRVGYNCLIGHNRYATKGAVNNVNAHPFDFENIVGAHNGTLRNYWSLDNASDFDVDSECLYSHINDNGVRDAFNKTDGAFALTWFDKTTNKLHLLRNTERPLCYCYREDMGAVFWASEAWMLRGVLGRNGIKHSDIVLITPNVLYSFDMPATYSTKGVKLGSPKVVKLEKPTVAKKSNVTSITHSKGVKPTSNYLSLTGYLNKKMEVCICDEERDVHGSHYISGFLSSKTEIDVRFYTPKNGPLWGRLMDKRDLGNFSCIISGMNSHNVAQPYLRADLRTITYLGDEKEVEADTVVGFNGKKLSYTEFREASDKGCAWCGDIALFGQPALWIDDKEFICGSCKLQEEVVEYLTDTFGGEGL